MYQTLRYEKQENIGILTINRPEALNALNSTVIGDLEQAITFDVEGTPGDTTLVCVVTPRDSALPVDRETLIRWLRIRTKVENVKLFVEP